MLRSKAGRRRPSRKLGSRAMIREHARCRGCGCGPENRANGTEASKHFLIERREWHQTFGLRLEQTRGTKRMKWVLFRVPRRLTWVISQPRLVRSSFVCLQVARCCFDLPPQISTRQRKGVRTSCSFPPRFLSYTVGSHYAKQTKKLQGSGLSVPGIVSYSFRDK